MSTGRVAPGIVTPSSGEESHVIRVAAAGGGERDELAVRTRDVDGAGGAVVRDPTRRGTDGSAREDRCILHVDRDEIAGAAKRDERGPGPVGRDASGLVAGDERDRDDG